jgi:hypothetical protein
MTISADLVTTLGATLSNRLYPSVAPAGVTVPYGVYQMISSVPLTSFQGMMATANARFQVDLFGREKIALDALAESVKAAMDAASLFKSVCVNQMDLYEDPAQFYRIVLDFSVWY